MYSLIVTSRSRCFQNQNSSLGDMPLANFFLKIDCLKQNSVIAKVATYAFVQPTLSFIYNYFTGGT